MDKLDTALKSHFAERHSIPAATRTALRDKLAQAAQKEKLPIVWLISPCMILASILILAVVDVLFGRSAAILLGTVYYLFVLLGGTTFFVILYHNLKFRKVTLT